MIYKMMSDANYFNLLDELLTLPAEVEWGE